MIIRNSLANLVGLLLHPLLSIILVPFYLHYLGLEGYGLVGFFAALVALLGVFTKGLGAAFQREVARRDSAAAERQTLRRLVRTFELSYWLIGASLALGLVALSGIISSDWIRLESLSQVTVRVCMILISLRIAIAFPTSIYQSVFVGMQRQVLGNTLSIIFALVNAASSVIMVLIWRSVLGFYANEVLNAGLGLLVLRYWSGKVLPTHEESLKVRFDWDELRKLWRLSVGLIWTNGIGLIVTQLDRIIISKLLPIAALGVYSAGIAGGRLLAIAYNSFLSAVYPQTCQIAKRGNTDELSAHLFRNAKVIMVLCMAFGLPISFFSSEILELWTRNPTIVKDGTAIMALYVYGNIFISCASVFYHGQMALGITRFGVMFNTAALLWFPLTMWFLVKHMGLVGAAWMWILYCALAWLFHVIVTMGILLERIHLSKYFIIVVLTAVASVILIFLTRYLATHYFSDLIWGRVWVAGMGGAVILGVCYLICFGFHFPHELVGMLNRAGRTGLGNQL